MLQHERRIFAWAPTWRDRAVALAKAFLFFVTYSFLFTTAMRALHPKIDMWPTGSILDFLRLEAIQFVFAVLVPVSLLVFLFRESPRVAGLGGVTRFKEFFAGVATGLSLISLTIGTLYVCGYYVPGALLLSPSEIAKYGSLYIATMLLVAICEESIFRGFGMVQLSRALSFWPAAILTSLLFGLEHASNGTITACGIASVCSAGLMLAYSFRRTGALYYAVGFHAAWDGGTTFLFGAIAVGLRLPDTMFRATIHGPTWLTGGGAGPIGGLLGFASFLIAGLVVHHLFGRSVAEAD